MHRYHIDAPMSVLHINGYSVGANINLAGDKGFLVAACGTVCLGSRNKTKSFVFIVCSFYLAMLGDMAKRRTLLVDERLSPKIE